MSSFYKLSIKNITKETSKSVSITLNIPENNKQDFKFIAGQYITLKANINGQEVRRAYSLCSSPNSGTIKVAIKAVENGVFSNYAINILQEQDILEVSKPEGKFTLEPQSDKNYLGLAAGSGITPILSMIKATLEENETATFTLLYGNKSVADTIFYQELNDLKNAYSSRFNLHYIFSKEKKENHLYGRINKKNTCSLLKNNSFNAAFLCGPEAMIDEIVGTLIENNFTSENIYFELFTTSTKDEKNSKENQEVQNGESEIKIILDDEETSFTMQQKDTILAAILRNKLDAPYSCQGGVCSSCIAKVTEGKAIMVKNQILSDKELEEGLILTCQAHPTTNSIIVDFDDV